MSLKSIKFCEIYLILFFLKRDLFIEDFLGNVAGSHLAVYSTFHITLLVSPLRFTFQLELYFSGSTSLTQWLQNS